MSCAQVYFCTTHLTMNLEQERLSLESHLPFELCQEWKKQLGRFMPLQLDACRSLPPAWCPILPPHNSEFRVLKTISIFGWSKYPHIISCLPTASRISEFEPLIPLVPLVRAPLVLFSNPHCWLLGMKCSPQCVHHHLAGCHATPSIAPLSTGCCTCQHRGLIHAAIQERSSQGHSAWPPQVMASDARVVIQKWNTLVFKSELICI